MNFLQICQDTQLECGVSGTLNTVIGQIGALGRVVSWVGKAWQDVQTEHDDWRWMRSSNILNPGVTGCQFATVSGQASYPLGTGPGTCGVAVAVFGKWCKRSFRNYATAVGVSSELYMTDIDYDRWRDGYMYGAQRSVKTRPVAIALGPDESLCVGPPSDGTYTITGDYYIAPTVMALDTDVPIGLPVAFHRIIVDRAMMLYGEFEAAPEVLAKGERYWKMRLAQLEALKMPSVRVGGALA